MDAVEESTLRGASIYILPPDIVCDYSTDQDLADEESGSINNLPGSILRQPAEFVSESDSSDREGDYDEDILPLTEIRKSIRNKSRDWKKRDLAPVFPAWEFDHNNVDNLDLNPI